MQHACNYHPQRFPTGQLSASSQSPDEASNHSREISARSVLLIHVPESHWLVDEKRELYTGEWRIQILTCGPTSLSQVCVFTEFTSNQTMPGNLKRYDYKQRAKNCWKATAENDHFCQFHQGNAETFGASSLTFCQLLG